jgi:hypothetical protein
MLQAFLGLGTVQKRVKILSLQKLYLYETCNLLQDLCSNRQRDNDCGYPNSIPNTKKGYGNSSVAGTYTAAVQKKQREMQ